MNDSYTIVFATPDSKLQQKCLPLLGRCFTEYWENIATKVEYFPFEEYSFIAVDASGEPIGHAGIMRFDVSDGQAGIWRFGGLASVAVDPNWRGRHIAQAICDSAAQWCEEQNLFASPLFTAFNRVYEGVGWNAYPICAPRMFDIPAGQTKALGTRMPQELSEAERDAIATFYQKGWDFPGKVCRLLAGKNIACWKRIFNTPDIAFAMDGDGYALFSDNVLAEMFVTPGKEQEFLQKHIGGQQMVFALPDEHPVWAALHHAGWQEIANENLDVWHGERVMVRPCNGNALPSGVYFPLADKF